MITAEQLAKAMLDLRTTIQISQAKTDEQMEKSRIESERSRKEADRKFDEKFEKSSQEAEKSRISFDKRFRALAKQVGNISTNQGVDAESYFYNSLDDDLSLGSVQYDKIDNNWKNHIGTIQEEYDIILINGNSLALIEVKYRVHINALDILDRKMNNFKTLFPMYSDYNVYGGIAGFDVRNDAKEEALKRGYFVLERKGEVIKTSSENIAVF